MPKKFLEGLAFGAGFAIAFVIVVRLTIPFLLPINFGLGGPVFPNHQPSPSSASAEVFGPKFDELPLEEQIKKSGIIVIVRYEPASDGRMKAMLREILKKDPGVTFPYAVGDELPSSSYYPKEEHDPGDGLIIFFAGSPPTSSESMSFSGDRISALGNIPLELLRKKCQNS